jgi:tetraacyldisaccharide 4'-kinase
MSERRAVRRVERLWYGTSAVPWLLLPLSAFFAAGVWLRRLLYARGWLRSIKVGAPVIVVGNITVGGTGKTPVVAWLARRLRATGCRPGIVSRGYGGRSHHEPVSVTAASRAEEVGDEPVVLARRTGVPVAVCVARVEAARRLVEQGADVILADDGLQHYALARDLEIIVVDGERRFGNGLLLPAGPLREPVKRLLDAGLVLVNGGSTQSADELGFRLRAVEAVALSRSERRLLASFSGQRVWAVAGIGDPGRFYATLRQHGIVPVSVMVPDHGRTDLALLRQQADWPILMTEKDAVKYPDCHDQAAWYVPVEVEMEDRIEARIMERVTAAIGSPTAGHDG